MAEKVQTIITGVRTRIDQAIDGMIDKAKDWFKSNGKKGRNPEEEQAEGEQQNDPATQLPDNRTPEQKRADFDKGMNEGMTALAAPNKTTAELQQSLQTIKLRGCFKTVFVRKNREIFEIFKAKSTDLAIAKASIFNAENGKKIRFLHKG